MKSKSVTIFVYPLISTVLSFHQKLRITMAENLNHFTYLVIERKKRRITATVIINTIHILNSNWRDVKHLANSLECSNLVLSSLELFFYSQMLCGRQTKIFFLFVLFLYRGSLSIRIYLKRVFIKPFTYWICDACKNSWHSWTRECMILGLFVDAFSTSRR